MTRNEQRVVAVATAMVAYDSQPGQRTWRELAAVAVAAIDAFDRLEGQLDGGPLELDRGTLDLDRGPVANVLRSAR